MTEDDFRDRIVRPLFLLRGMGDGRDLCGPNEAGKDSVFTATNPLGLTDVYALQTKKGRLNLARNVTGNVTEAATQLRTALETNVLLLPPMGKTVPNRAILCASGKINESARQYILDHVKNPNISFFDSDDLIPDIDKRMPEFWLEIDVNLLPYVRALKRSVDNGTQIFTRGELIAANLPPVATSQSSFVSLRAFRIGLKRKLRNGKFEQMPSFDEFPVTALLSRKETRILLLGGAGSGKSTALLRMLYMLCEKIERAGDSSPIPVIFRAQELTSPGESVLDAIITRTQEVGGTKATPFTREDLEKGYVCVFVDSLDELGDSGVQQGVVSKLLTFSTAFPRCRVILASRPDVSVDDIPQLAHFTEFTISSINYKDAERIIERLRKGQSLPLSKASEFLRRLQEVHGWELNPLIVTVFAASSDTSRSDVPANITELFKKFTEQLLGRWDASKGLASQYQAPLKDFILTQVAFRLHSRRENRMFVDEFRSLIAQELTDRGHKADVDELTDEVLNRSGLFRVVNRMVEFRHFMLQEFFAGRGIPSSASVESLVTDGWWRRALVFYFGDRPNESNLLRSVCESLKTRKGHTLLTATVTLGLSIQASYLIETSKKLPLVVWMFEKLADLFHTCDQELIKDAEFPLGRFLDHVLFSREAVAFSLLKDEYAALKAELFESALVESSIAEIRQFWVIEGLIECGDLEAAESLLRNFAPSDRRFLLALHLGSFLVLKRRVTTPQERETAQRICELMKEKIPDLRAAILNEFKTELLEVQRGRVQALQDNPLQDRNL